MPELPPARPHSEGSGHGVCPSQARWKRAGHWCGVFHSKGALIRGTECSTLFRNNRVSYKRITQWTKQNTKMSAVRQGCFFTEKEKYLLVNLVLPQRWLPREASCCVRHTLLVLERGSRTSCGVQLPHTLARTWSSQSSVSAIVVGSRGCLL